MLEPKTTDKTAGWSMRRHRASHSNLHRIFAFLCCSCKSPKLDSHLHRSNRPIRWWKLNSGQSLSSPDDRYCKRLRDPLIFLQLNLCALSFRHESGVVDATSATHHECYMPFLDGRANRAAECRCAPNCNSQFCISRRRREPHKHHLQCLRFQSSQLLHLSAGLPIAR